MTESSIILPFQKCFIYASVILCTNSISHPQDRGYVFESHITSHKNKSMFTRREARDKMEDPSSKDNGNQAI